MWFRDADPVEEAADSCIARFSEGNMDPLKLHSGSRSWRLFTEVRFWLAQRVGARALPAVMKRATRHRAGLVADPGRPGAMAAAWRPA